MRIRYIHEVIDEYKRVGLITTWGAINRRGDCVTLIAGDEQPGPRFIDLTDLIRDITDEVGRDEGDLREAIKAAVDLTWPDYWRDY